MEGKSLDCPECRGEGLLHGIGNDERETCDVCGGSGHIDDVSHIIPTGVQHIEQTLGYETLYDVLSDAYDQASKGKGKDRHAQDLPFDRQPMQQVAQLVGIGFPLGQAIKKVQEAQRLPYERARAELLGAINYIAGAIIYLDNDR